MLKLTMPLLTIFVSIGPKADAQILRVTTSPATIANQIPGYNQVTTITTKTYSYTPSVPFAPPDPIDEDTTTEDDKRYNYADILTANISMSDGNITNTSIGKVWTLKIDIPNALNIGFIFNQFNLSSGAEMYIFNEARTALDSCIKSAHFTNSPQLGIFPFKGNRVIIYIVEPNNFGNFLSSVAIQKLEAGFQEIDDVGDTGGQLNRASVNCDPHVMCQLNKMMSARAVARFSSNEFIGTGTLLNNENSNGRAFFFNCFSCS